MGHRKGSPKRKVYLSVKNTERSQIYHIVLHLKLIEKQEQLNTKQSEGNSKYEG
jgi:hypothetical protein